MRLLFLIVLLCFGGSISAAPVGDDKAKANRVIVTPAATIKIIVGGSVKKPGTYELRLPVNLAQAIEAAGGPSAFASGGIRITSPAASGKPARTLSVRVSFKELKTAGGPDLADGDSVMLIQGCIAAGTPLATKAGVRLIEQIKVGDFVLGYDFQKKRVCYGKVVAVRQETSPALLTLNGRLTLTPNHPVWTSTGWVEAGKLRPKVRQLLTAHGPEMLTKITRVAAKKQSVVYDLTVEPTACFFAADILVHNKW